MTIHSESGSRILVVEDEKHIAEGLRLNLALLGYEVEIALDGVAALERWKTWRPDLIVLDVMLPGIDGWSVLQSIRLEDEKIPILILSAKATPDDRIRGLTRRLSDQTLQPRRISIARRAFAQTRFLEPGGRSRPGGRGDGPGSGFQLWHQYGGPRHRHSPLSGRCRSADRAGAQTAQAVHTAPRQTALAPKNS